MVAIDYVPFHDARKWEREGMRTRDAHVYEHLRDRYGTESIVVVDRPTCLAEWARLRGRWTPTGQMVGRLGNARLTQSVEGWRVIDQIVYHHGFRRRSFHAWVMQAYGAARFSRVIDSLRSVSSTSDGVLWLCHPFAANMIDHRSNRRVVVDAFDNFSIHPEFRPDVRSAVREAYQRLCAAADRIVVNSVATAEFLWTLAKRETLLVPNGVDPERFADAAPLPLVDCERPIIGYAGKLAQRIDVDLIRDLATAMSAGTIVLAGQMLNAKWMAPVRHLPRVRYLGDLAYDVLPSFLAACDVCIVPHRVGAGENHGDATKIYEYLAAGRPVVTTAIGGVDAFKARIHIATSNADFVSATVSAMEGGAPTAQGGGGVKPEETWRARVAAICQYFGLPEAGDAQVTT